jgi:hypothetical protein
MLSTTSRRLLAWLAILALAPFGSLAEEPEDELKAAVVLSFLRYGEWDQTLPGNAVLTVGVLGRPEFAGVLRHSMEGKSVNGRAVQVVELKSAAQQHACQVIYLAGDNNPEIKAALENPALARVLTIGETRDFLDWGGAINLFVFHGHMSFEVSLDALERSGVSISSRLLRFGQIRNRK